MQDKIKKQGGFTVLELLIVVVIVAILAIIIIPSALSGPQNSRDKIRKNDLRNIKTALETYYTDNQIYPQVSNYYELGNPLVPNYLSKLPQDPKNTGGHSYKYTTTSGTSYTLSTMLENAKDNQATGSNGTYVVSSSR